MWERGLPEDDREPRELGHDGQIKPPLKLRRRLHPPRSSRIPPQPILSIYFLEQRQPNGPRHEGLQASEHGDGRDGSFVAFGRRRDEGSESSRRSEEASAGADELI